MPGFFDALANFESRKKSNPTVEIQGEKIQVDAETFKLVEKHGSENFKIVDGQVKRIKTKRFKKTYFVLEKSDEGYVFHDRDPYWPVEYGKGGYQWQDELE